MTNWPQDGIDDSRPRDCPFCGSDDIKMRDAPYLIDHVFMACTKCGAYSKAVNKDYVGHYGKVEAVLIHKWNRRSYAKNINHVSTNPGDN